MTDNQDHGNTRTSSITPVWLPCFRAALVGRTGDAKVIVAEATAIADQALYQEACGLPGAVKTVRRKLSDIR